MTPEEKFLVSATPEEAAAYRLGMKNAIAPEHLARVSIALAQAMIAWDALNEISKEYPGERDYPGELARKALAASANISLDGGEGDIKMSLRVPGTPTDAS